MALGFCFIVLRRMVAGHLLCRETAGASGCVQKGGFGVGTFITKKSFDSPPSQHSKFIPFPYTLHVQTSSGFWARV
jgi:hypothetical protein